MDDLPGLFSTVLKEYSDISHFDGSHCSDEFNTLVRNACLDCQQAVSMLNRLGLFSKNETIDDLSSNDIRYLILPALYGYFLSQRNDERTKNVKNALSLYSEFLDLCSVYGFCQAHAQEQTNSAVHNREAKIKRYKEKKDLEENLKRLAIYVEQPHVDDEVKRDYHSTLIRFWICLVKDELPTLKQEEQLLSISPEQLQEKKEPVAKPMKPFIITRDAIQAAVFGAGYPSLPTMSLDELCTHQVQKGIFPSPKPISTDKVPSVRRIDPSETEKEAAEKKAAEEDALEDADDPQRLLKARQWDEFKDETRKGSGNRMNRA